MDNPNGSGRKSCINKSSSKFRFRKYTRILYKSINFSFFDKGKCWEKGVPLCKELANFYETKLYDYNKLSDVLKTEAKFFQNILTEIRLEPEYFRVGFFGKGFPLFVRVSTVSVNLFIHLTHSKFNFRTNNSFIADSNMSEFKRSQHACKLSSHQHNSTPKIHHLMSQS